MKAVVVWVVVAVAGCHAAHPPPAPVRQSSLSLAMSGLSLSNGLRVVVVHDPAASEIEVTMRYRVGSVDDGADHPGIAHLVEHLMFQQMLGAQSLFAHLEDDATFFNGETSFDATTYMSRAPKAKLDELLSIEAVRVGFRCTTISEAAFEREREVVVNELRQHDTVSEAWAVLHEAIYPAGHPYRQPTIGSVDSVRTITREQACAFADAHYAPTNGVLVVSGNITPDEVITSLKKFLARVARRDVVAPTSVPPPPDAGRRGTASAPIDDPLLVVAWPLPPGQRERVEVDAIAVFAQSAIDGAIKGRVHEFRLGDVRAPMIGFVIEPAHDETLDEIRTSIDHALGALPSQLRRVHSQLLGDLAFDMMQQSAIYREYDALESPATRDAELAQAVLDGDDPQQVLAATFTGLRELTPESASDIARTRFAFDHATLVELQPSGKKSGHTVALAAPVHDAGLRRDVPDPSEAQKPLPPAPSPLAAAHTRTLPNGMTVVLLPLTSVPAIDIRLVFATGTADEDPNQRGAAIEAGYGLQFDLRYLNDLLLFAGAGGTQLVDVEPDTTTFEARGVDMHLDLLLAGLRRWVREGYYEDDELADALRTQAKRADDNGTLTDAWRGALYGKDHPYVAAGLVRRAAPNLSGDQVRAFRAAHYTPDNATLVIAGRFDAAIADRWIDFLFSDWKGHAARRVSPEARAASASLAQFHDTAQVGLNIALPANTGSRAARLVAGEMLQEIADDVRHQLGASYGLHASYEEERLAGTYAIAGWVDAARTADAVQLVRDRLAELRALPDAPFIIARRRVVSRLDSLATSAAALASRVERAVAIDVAPLADIETTAAARALTVADVAPLLADLDLSRASVLLSGPEPDVRHAFDVLGRTPTVVPTFHDADTGDEPATAPPATTHHAQRDSVTIADLEPAITEQGAPDPLMITLGIGAVASSAVEQGEMLHYDCCDGYSLFGELGYRFDAKHAVGLHLAYARTTGQYGTPMMLTMTPMSISAIEGDLFFQAVAYDRLWGALSFGVHVDSIDGTTQMLQGTEAALSFGLTGGVDLLTRGIHRFGPYLQVEGTFLSTSGYGSIGFGAAYRR